MFFRHKICSSTKKRTPTNPAFIGIPRLFPVLLGSGDNRTRTYAKNLITPVFFITLAIRVAFHVAWGFLISFVSALNGKTSGSIIPTDYIDTIQFRRCGNLVEMILGRITKDTGVTRTITIGTAPVGFRPNASETRIIPVTLSGYMIYIGVVSNGDIAIRFTENIPSGAALYNAITYIGA